MDNLFQLVKFLCQNFDFKFNFTNVDKNYNSLNNQLCWHNLNGASNICLLLLWVGLNPENEILNLKMNLNFSKWQLLFVFIPKCEVWGISVWQNYWIQTFNKYSSYNSRKKFIFFKLNKIQF